MLRTTIWKEMLPTKNSGTHLPHLGYKTSNDRIQDDVNF